jgi:hypothetical protein
VRPTSSRSRTAPHISGSWPSPTDTGASGSLANVNGDVLLSKAGQTYQNKRVHGMISVTACNVTIRNVEVTVGINPNTTDDQYGLWLKQPEKCKAVVDRVTIQAAPAPNNYVTTGIRIAYGAPTNITASKIIGTQDGILGMGSGLLADSYIYLGSTKRGDHNDGFQNSGSDGITLRHNTILNPNSQTSVLALFTEDGANRNLLVEDNLLAGGGYTCYCGDGKADNNGNPARSVNVDVVNNVFWKKFSRDVGFYGAARAYNPAGGGEWTNNVYMDANGTLTKTQVPRPGIDQ